MSNLTLRLLTAAVMIPLLLALLFFGPDLGWLGFLLLVAIVGATELFGMTHGDDTVAKVCGVVLTWAVVLAMWFGWDRPRLLLAALLVLPFASIVLTLWRLGEIPTAALRVAASSFGPLYLGAGLGAIALLRRNEDGATWVVMSLLLAWMSDTGGYFAGRAFGRTKLYEAVSPKKTVEGAVGGVAATIVGALVMRHFLLPDVPIVHMVALAVVGSIAGIAGDLGESVLKRSVGVKDSGGIWPGHGGMLDRIDAVLITAPIALLYLIAQPR